MDAPEIADLKGAAGSCAAARTGVEYGSSAYDMTLPQVLPRGRIRRIAR
jgi:hypothetical protein